MSARPRSRDIARVSVLVPGLRIGGMTRAYVLAGALRHSGLDVEIVGGLPPGERVYPEPPPGVTVKPVPERSFLRRLLATRRAARGDLLYAVKPMLTSFGLALLCRGGRPVLLDIDDGEASGAGHAAGGPTARPRGTMRRAGSALRRWRDVHTPGTTRWLEQHVRRADAVTANTRVLVERFGATYLPSGKDTALFDPSPYDPDECRRALGLTGRRVLMFPGTPRVHKGLDDLVAALEMLQWPDARLVLVGGRDTGTRLGEELARRHPRWIVRLGRFGVSAMPGVIAAAHVVVAPQRDTAVARAQCPMKLMDAMAMAKPILSTRVGDIPAVVDGAAYLVAPSAPAELAQALHQIFTDPDEATRRGRRARQLCEERYSFERLGHVLSALTERLREARHRGFEPAATT